MWSVPNPLGLMHEGQIYLYFINFFSCTHFCHGCFICDSKKYYCLKISIPSSENVFFSFISVRLELFFFRSIFFSFSHEKEKNRASRARIELFWGNIAGTLQSEDIPGWCWNMLEQPPAVYLELWIICWLEIFCNPCKAAHLYFVCSGCLFIYWLPSFFFCSKGQHAALHFVCHFPLQYLPRGDLKFRCKGPFTRPPLCYGFCLLSRESHCWSPMSEWMAGPCPLTVQSGHRHSPALLYG